jgi:hypothetical protein
VQGVPLAAAQLLVQVLALAPVVEEAQVLVPAPALVPQRSHLSKPQPFP